MKDSPTANFVLSDDIVTLGNESVDVVEVVVEVDVDVLAGLFTVRPKVAVLESPDALIPDNFSWYVSGSAVDEEEILIRDKQLGFGVQEVCVKEQKISFDELEQESLTSSGDP